MLRTECKLVVLGIETLLGAHYSFPDVPVDELSRVLPRGAVGVPVDPPSLCLINISLATLVVPYRVIKRITADGEEWWTASGV